MSSSALTVVTPQTPFFFERDFENIYRILKSRVIDASSLTEVAPVSLTGLEYPDSLGWDMHIAKEVLVYAKRFFRFKHVGSEAKQQLQTWWRFLRTAKLDPSEFVFVVPSGCIPHGVSFEVMTFDAQLEPEMQRETPHSLTTSHENALRMHVIESDAVCEPGELLVVPFNSIHISSMEKAREGERITRADFKLSVDSLAKLFRERIDAVFAALDEVFGLRDSQKN